MNINYESILDVKHVTDKLFYFKSTRNPMTRFRNGEFVMMGLDLGVEHKKRYLLRAYSIVSANYEDYLEFYSIKVNDGPLTSRLKNIVKGDKIVVNPKATGTLVLDNLKKGRNLYLISTGTGVAPFMGIARAIETYEQYKKVILFHGVSYTKELAFDKILNNLNNDEKYGQVTLGNFLYYPTVTREDYKNMGRVTDALYQNKVVKNYNLETFDKNLDSAMVCGSMDMNLELKDYFINELKCIEGNNKKRGDFVLERAFVD